MTVTEQPSALSTGHTDSPARMSGDCSVSSMTEPSARSFNQMLLARWSPTAAGAPAYTTRRPSADTVGVCDEMFSTTADGSCGAACGALLPAVAWETPRAASTAAALPMWSQRRMADVMCMICLRTPPAVVRTGRILLAHGKMALKRCHQSGQ